MFAAVKCTFAAVPLIESVFEGMRLPIRSVVETTLLLAAAEHARTHAHARTHTHTHTHLSLIHI